MGIYDCIKSVLAKYPDATPKDVESLYNSMTSEYQKAFAEGLGNPKSEYAAKAEKALEDRARQAQNTATEAKENLGKRAIIEATFKDPRFKGNKAAALIHIAETISDGHQVATRRALGVAFLQDLDERNNPGIVDIWKSGYLDREIYQMVSELAGGKELPGPKSKEAQVIAKAVHRFNKMEMYYYTEAGAHINDLEGHIAHQGHDPQQLRMAVPGDIEASLEKWKADTLPLLDHDKTFNRSFFEIDKDGLMDGIFKDVVEEKHKNLQSEASDQFAKIIGTPSNMARRAEMGKKLFFKDGYSQYDYNQMYGKKTLSEQIASSMSTTARNTSMMQELGTNPKATWERLQSGLDATERQQLANYMADMDGSTRFVGNSLKEQIGNTSRSIIGMAKLGFAVTSHMSMIMPRAARLTFNGENMLSALSKSMTSLYDTMSAENRAETMRIHGIGADATLGHIFNELGGHEGLKGKMGQANDLFYKLNGMHYLIEGSRLASAQELGAQFGGQAGKSFGNLEPGMARSLMGARIDPVAWELIRASMEPTERGPVIGSNTIAKLPAEKVEAVMRSGNLIPEGAKPAEVKRMVEKYRFSTQQNWAAYMNNAVDTDMGVSGISNRANILHGGTLSNTVVGQIRRSVMQFKAFPLSMMTRWGDFAKNEIMAKESGFDKVGTVTGLATSGLMLGYISYATNEALHGRGMPDPHKTDTWIRSATKSGVMGYFGDFLAQNLENSGKFSGASDSILGPTFGQGGDSLKVLKDLRSENHPLEKAGKQALRVLGNNVPGPQNFPIALPVMQHLFLNDMAERMSPGYLSRQRTRMKQSGQSSIFGN